MIKFSPKINIREKKKKKKPKKSIYIHNKPSRQFVSAEVTMRWVVLACSWSGSWRCPDCQDWLFTLLQSLFPLYEMCPKAVFLYLLQAKSIQKLSSTSIIEKRVHVFKQTVIFQATNYITIQRARRKIFPECNTQTCSHVWDFNWDMTIFYWAHHKEMIVSLPCQLP